MVRKESWESAAPQKCIHKSGNFTAAEEGEIASNYIYNCKTYTKYDKHFRVRLE